MSPDREPRHVPVLPAETLRLLDPKPGRNLGRLHGRGGRSHAADRRVLAVGKAHRARSGPDDARARPPAAGGIAGHLGSRELRSAGRCAREPRDWARSTAYSPTSGSRPTRWSRPDRGLSFRDDGPLDMRLDPTTGATAADLVNTMSEKATRGRVLGIRRGAEEPARGAEDRRAAEVEAVRDDRGPGRRGAELCAAIGPASTRRPACSRRCGSR